MKTSIFAVNDVYDVNECGLRAAGGHRAIGLQNIEDELIQDIDEQKMSSAKLLATKFLTFLVNKRLTLESLKLLSVEEQQNLKKEFLENN